CVFITKLTFRDTSSLSKKSKFIARSVGSLHINADLDSAENICREESRFPSKLAQTIENLKKASNPDLTQFDVSNNVKLSRETGIEDGEIEAFYFLRNQRGKGAVQKKVERFQPRISRETTSGESDSNGSEVNNNSSFVRNDASSVNQRYFSMNGSNRIKILSSVSCVERLPRQSLLQSTRRIFEQQRRNSCNSSTNVSRRVPNYLVQKFAEDMVGPDVGAEESPRQLSSPSDLSAFNELDGRNQQSKRKFIGILYFKFFFSYFFNECLIGFLFFLE
ncbi:unnamed protein product, partial [Dracunculus medinensis]|uniref:Uncharacterized protein n=1 Tax=Dracunculus medinensis TaxID=318479 RepID=A0A158Q519_DRAME